MTRSRAGRDDLSDALRAIVAAVDDNDRNNELIRRRARLLLDRRAGGDSWSEIIASEEPPLIVELINDNMQRHYDVGGRLRRAEAATLHREGMTMEQIAALFGVSRQRVSQLLKAPRDAG